MVLLMTSSLSRHVWFPDHGSSVGVGAPRRHHPRTGERMRSTRAVRAGSGRGARVPMVRAEDGALTGDATTDNRGRGGAAGATPARAGAGGTRRAPGQACAAAKAGAARACAAGLSRALRHRRPPGAQAGDDALAPDLAVGGGGRRHGRARLAHLQPRGLDPHPLGLRPRRARVRPPADVLGAGAAVLPRRLAAAGGSAAGPRRLLLVAARLAGRDPHGRVVGREPAQRLRVHRRRPGDDPAAVRRRRLGCGPRLAQHPARAERPGGDRPARARGQDRLGDPVRGGAGARRRSGSRGRGEPDAGSGGVERLASPAGRIESRIYFSRAG